MHSGSSMISRHDDALQTRVGAILAVPAGQRADLIGSFIADYQEQFARLAGRLCTTFRVPADEARSVVLSAAFDLLTDVDAGQVHNFMGYLSVVARHEMVRHVDQSANAGMTGLTGQQRRARSLARARIAFQVLHGHLPSDAELVEFHNAAMEQRRSSAARQGALVGPAQPAPVVIEGVEDATWRAVDPGPLTPQEGRELVRVTIDRCQTLDPRLGKIARAFLGGHLIAPGETDARIINLCRAARVPVTDVPELMARVRAVAVQVAQEMLSA